MERWLFMVLFLLPSLGFAQPFMLNAQKIRVFVDTVIHIEFPMSTKDVWEAYENRYNPNFYLKMGLYRSLVYFDLDFKEKKNRMKRYKDRSESAFGNILKLERFRVASGDAAIYLETFDPKAKTKQTFTLIELSYPYLSDGFTYLWLVYYPDASNTFMCGDFSRVIVRSLDE